MHIWLLTTKHEKELSTDKETPTLKKKMVFATALGHQRTVHNDYLFSAQDNSKEYFVERFGGTTFYHSF